MANISGIIKTMRNYMRNDRGINGDAQRLEQLGWMFFLKIFDSREEIMELEEDEYQSPIPEHLKWKNWAADAEGMTGDALLDFVDNTLFPALQELQVGTDDSSRIAFLIRETFRGNNNYMKSETVMRQVINKIDEIKFNRTEEKHLFGNIYEGLLKEEELYQKYRKTHYRDQPTPLMKKIIQIRQSLPQKEKLIDEFTKSMES